MSPYLFVLVMEYLNRTLKQLSNNLDFIFHPKCSKLQLTHICFVDDLLMCCRGVETSLRLLLKELDNFSQMSGLQANMEKSSLYIAGVSQETKNSLVAEFQLTKVLTPIQIPGSSLVNQEDQYCTMLTLDGQDSRQSQMLVLKDTVLCWKTLIDQESFLRCKHTGHRSS